MPEINLKKLKKNGLLSFSKEKAVNIKINAYYLPDNNKKFCYNYSYFLFRKALS
jgi:hypothetical protein